MCVCELHASVWEAVSVGTGSLGIEWREVMENTSYATHNRAPAAGGGVHSAHPMSYGSPAPRRRPLGLPHGPPTPFARSLAVEPRCREGATGARR